MKRWAILLGLALGWLGARRWLRPSPGWRVGRLAGIPYDLRLPTPDVLRERFWNPEDQRLFTPHVLGWGWSINFYEAGRRLGRLR